MDDVLTRDLAQAAVNDPVPDLVADGEPPPRRRPLGLLGVDPDLAQGGKEQAADVHLDLAAAVHSSSSSRISRP